MFLFLFYPIKFLITIDETITKYSSDYKSTFKNNLFLFLFSGHIKKCLILNY